MPGEEQIICIGCPMGCLVTLTVENGEVIAIKDNRCKQGEKYVLKEYHNPVRTLTTTLRTTGSSRRLLPVRTSIPIPKVNMLSVMALLAGIRVKPPIRMGETIISQPDGVEADIIATSDLSG